MKKPLTLVIANVWPEPTSSAASIRTLQILKCFADFGHSVALACGSKQSDRKATNETLTRTFGLPHVNELFVRPNDIRFNSILKVLKPNVVVFDRFYIEEQFGWRVNECLPDAVRIVDSQDLHFLRDFRMAQTHGDVNLVSDRVNNFDEAVATTTATRELASFIRSDMTLIISREEKRMLNDHAVHAAFRSEYVPFLFNSSAPVDQQFRRFEERSPDLVMIGNFLHKPNLDSINAVRQFYDHAPDVDSLPCVNIFGAYCPSHQTGTVSSDKLRILGYCESAMDTISCHRVLFAPLRFGAGLKGKLFDAMLSRTAFVTSRIGAEGIIDLKYDSIRDDVKCLSKDIMALPRPLLHGRMKQLCVADTMSEAIFKAQLLNQDSTLWNEAVALGTLLIQREFSHNSHVSSFRSALETLIGGDVSQSQCFENFGQRRNACGNVMQRILNHENNHSTRMMSKYVELKRQKGRE